MSVGLYLSVLITSCYGAFISKCKLGSPDSDVCVDKALESIFRASKEGLPEYGITASFDPLVLPKLTIGTGKGAVQLTQYYNDLSVTGFSDLTIENAHFDLEKLTLEFLARLPKIVQMGHYKLNGKILALPINGDGQSTLELSNTAINVKFSFQKVRKGERIYLNVTSCVLDIRPQRMKINFDNLFNGNKMMGDNMNKVINDEWQALFNDVKASIDETYAEVFKGYWEKFFTSVPIEKIFPK